MFITELTLLVTILAWVSISACEKREIIKKNFLHLHLPIIGLLAAGFYSFVTFSATKDSYFSYENMTFKGFKLQELFIVSGMTQVLKMCAISIGAVAVLLIQKSKEIYEEVKSETIVLLLIAILGVCVQVSSINLILSFVSIETIFFCCYYLVAIKAKDARSGEAAIKLFYQGVVGSLVLASAITIIYWLTKSFDMATIAKEISNLSQRPESKVFLLLSFSVLMMAVLFKMNAFPFHFTIVDVVDGATIPSGLIILTLPLIGMIATVQHFVLNTFCLHSETKWVPYFEESWVTLFSFIGIATVALSAIAAINQSNIKRFIALISTAQVGFIILSFSTGAPSGISALLMNIVVYSVSIVGFFILLQLVSKGKGIENVNEISGLVPRSWFHSFFFVIFLINIVGVPPLSGFLSKFYTLGALFKTNMVWISIFLVFTWILLFAAIVQFFKTMFQSAENKEVRAMEWSAENVLLIFLGAMVVIFGIFGDRFFRLFINILE